METHWKPLPATRGDSTFLPIGAFTLFMPHRQAQAPHGELMGRFASRRSPVRSRYAPLFRLRHLTPLRDAVSRRRAQHAIVLRIRTDKTDEFKRQLAEEEISIWDEFSEVSSRATALQFGMVLRAPAGSGQSCPPRIPGGRSGSVVPCHPDSSLLPPLRSLRVAPGLSSNRRGERRWSIQLLKGPPGRPRKGPLGHIERGGVKHGTLRESLQRRLLQTGLTGITSETGTTRTVADTRSRPSSLTATTNAPHVRRQEAKPLV
jgi:hypothetical protein